MYNIGIRIMQKAFIKLFVLTFIPMWIFHSYSKIQFNFLRLLNIQGTR